VELRIRVGEREGEVSALLDRPPDAWSLLVLAHGAGAGMRHPFMTQVSDRLTAKGVATLRYQFPYMEAGRAGGRRAPNPPGVLTATVRSAVDAARREAPDLPLFAGGKSLGGRMTSTASSRAPLQGVRGIVFLGFPLHAPGKPGRERADHLAAVDVPMLFVQGTRDDLADLERLRPVVSELGTRAALHVVEGGDHSFHVLKRSGRRDEEVLEEIATELVRWSRAVLDRAKGG